MDKIDSQETLVGLSQLLVGSNWFPKVSELAVGHGQQGPDIRARLEWWNWADRDNGKAQQDPVSLGTVMA